MPAAAGGLRRGRFAEPGADAREDGEGNATGAKTGKGRGPLPRCGHDTYQTILTPYSRKTGSDETSGRRSLSACAASSRSNGSR